MGCTKRKYKKQECPTELFIYKLSHKCTLNDNETALVIIKRHVLFFLKKEGNKINKFLTNIDCPFSAL